MPSSLTLSEFCKKASKIHNNKYDYSISLYNGRTNLISINCPIHGTFSQNAGNHLNGHGCPKCRCDYISGLFAMSEHDFLEKSYKIHGKNKYDYSKVIYKRHNKKIQIICKKHGCFLQLPSNHLKGQGCPKCGIEKTSNSHTKSIDSFVKDAFKIHGNRYDYSKVTYKGGKTKVTIVCSLHGQFYQRPNDHLKGCGCPKCRTVKMSLSRSEFIKKAINVHDKKYDYSNTVYVNNHSKVKIRCFIHGTFKQTPHCHLKGRGCPKCCHSISKNEKRFLDYLNIPDTEDSRQVTLSGKRVDGYDSKTNTVYEFLGDYWHGNPSIFSGKKINKSVKQAFKTLHDRTFDKFNHLKNAGYNIKYIWENDWKNYLKNSTSLNIISY